MSVGLLGALVTLLRVSHGLPNEISRPEAATALDVLRRAAPANQPHGYTPQKADCPDTPPSVRSAHSLSQEETSWLQTRRKQTVPAMRDFLNRMNISDFDVNGYFSSHSDDSDLPNIGIAASGGGYRALLNGAGVLAAFDDRTSNSTNTGHIGGLLQSSTYLAGLSGGSWLVGSIYMNNFSTVENLRDDTSGTIWEFGNSVLEGPDRGGIQVLDTAQYFGQLGDEVQGKEDAGFETTFTDYWGRALSFQLINAPQGGSAYTWSSIATSDQFTNGSVPFPIVVADERGPGQSAIPSNTTVYEFGPFEFGTFDPTAYGFIPMNFLGTNFTSGNVPDGDQCITGFDNSGFVYGTSSSLFNQIILAANSTSLPQDASDLINKIVSKLGINDEDIADYSPNPFFGFGPNNPSGSSTTLNLVDGGEDLQNIPLHPLIQPIRNVDVIFAIDSSADVNNWPNATALVASYERSLNQSGIANRTVFPSIPGQGTIVNLGLNSRPTFFGCDASNYSSKADQDPPLIVYLPNSPYIAFSNISTFQLTYNDTQRDAVIENGYDVATMGNGTADSEWPTCVGCAILKRSFGRTNTKVPNACNRCFDRYCWNGTLSDDPPMNYLPQPRLTTTNIKSAAASLKGPSGLMLATVVGVLGLLFF
ncbi:MAG: hypothetical protein Q9227_000651 [Pyrenula ochraceoflavens]